MPVGLRRTRRALPSGGSRRRILALGSVALWRLDQITARRIAVRAQLLDAQRPCDLLDLMSQGSRSLATSFTADVNRAVTACHLRLVLAGAR